MSPFPIFKYFMRNKVRRSVDFTAFPHSLFSSSQFREVGRRHAFRAILLRRNVTFIGCPRSPRLYVAKAGCDAHFSASEFRALLTIPSWPCSMRSFTDSSYIDLIQGGHGFLAQAPCITTVLTKKYSLLGKLMFDEVLSSNFS